MLVGGSFYDSVNGLLDLKASDFDANTGFVVHSYDPSTFCMQAIADYIPYIEQLHYPPIPSDEKAAIANVAALTTANGRNITGLNTSAIIADNTSRLSSYFSTPQDATYIKSLVATVSSWCATNNVAPSQIFLTEFGAHNLNTDTGPGTGATVLARSAYYQDAFAAWHTFGACSTVWCYNSPDAWDLTTESSASGGGAWTLRDEFLVALQKVGSTSYEAEAIALFSRMELQPSVRRRALINVTIRLLKATGVWKLLDGFYGLAASTPQVALLNWIGAPGSLSVKGAPSFAVNGGYTGTGALSAGYLDTGMVLGNGTLFTQNFGHMGIYKGNTGGVSAPAMLNGYYDTGVGMNANEVIVGIADREGILYRSALPSSNGSLIVNRVDPANLNYYYKGSHQSFVTAASKPLATSDMSNTVKILSATGIDANVKAAHFGAGLTDSNARDLYTIIKFYVDGLAGSP